jgi:hypothetical protein
MLNATFHGGGLDFNKYESFDRAARMRLEPD